MTVMPAYGGQSLLNLPASICRALGAPPDNLAAPLDEGVLPAAVLDGVRAVVLLVVDGLGRAQLDAAIAAGDAPTLDRLAGRAGGGAEVSLATLTSVFPSSTIPALATISSGVAPARHGLIGWTVFLEEFGQVAELARWGPLGSRDSYQDERLGRHDPSAFFGLETVYQRLAGAGVRSIVVNRAAFKRSALSRMLYRGADFRGYHVPSSLFVIVERALTERAPGERLYVHAYLDPLDLVAHLEGPLGPEHTEELAALDAALGRWLRRRPRQGDVLFLLTADHGHVPTPSRASIRLDAPALLGLLRALPCGERRLAYLHARRGREADLRDYAATHLSHATDLLDPADAFRDHLFGPDPPSRAARRRAGDLLLLAHPDRQFLLPSPDGHAARPFLGNHGALEPHEMEVPLLAARL